jgi:hypothetical protein
LGRWDEAMQIRLVDASTELVFIQEEKRLRRWHGIKGRARGRKARANVETCSLESFFLIRLSFSERIALFREDR